MRPTHWAFGVVFLCVLVPAILIYALSSLPTDIAGTAKEFQTLIGASVALGAAIIAFTSINLQIASTRNLERERRAHDQQQLASALRGELSAFASVARRRSMVQYYRENAAAVAKAGAFQFWSLALSPEYDKVFRSVGPAIGKLPDELPERVVGAYALISGVFDRMAASERGDYNRLTGQAAVDMLNLLADEADEAIKTAVEVAGLLGHRATA